MLGTQTEYSDPPIGQTITRLDHCPNFQERDSLFVIDPICWFCKYAAFDLFSDKLPEHGVCKYPDTNHIMKRRNTNEEEKTD